VFERISADDIERHARSEEIPRLLAAYARAAHADGVADHARFNPAVLAGFTEYLMALAPTPDGDFIYEFVGDGVRRHSGFELMGRRTSSLGGGIGQLLIDAYAKTLAAGRPMHARHRATRAVSVSMWERLICPTRRGDGSHGLVVFNKPIEFRADLLTTILDAAPMGVMAFHPSRDDARRMTDAHLVTVNRHAAMLVGASEAKLVGQSIFDIFPTLKPRGLWSRYLSVDETRAATQFDAQRNGDPDGAWYRVTIAPWSDGFIVMFTDVTELKLALQRLRHQTVALCQEVDAEKATRNALAAELQTAAAREEELREAVETDSLTGILNRRGFDRAVEVLASARDGANIAIHFALFDIDHFKSVNDTWGHAAGDEVLKSFASRLDRAMAAYDGAAARIGGEEFAVCLRLDAAADAAEILRNLQRAATAEPFPLGNGLAAPLTCSVGCSLLSCAAEHKHCLARADVALYDAKRLGRNRVRIAQAA
jgi:diguanylate cyclase (GGDEF)-like protein